MNTCEYCTDEDLVITMTFQNLFYGVAGNHKKE